MADVKNDFSYEGAHEANTELGNSETAIKLLNDKNPDGKQNPGATVLNKYEEAERLKVEKAELEETSRIDVTTGVGNQAALEDWLREDEERQAFLKSDNKEKRLPTGRLYPSFGVIVFFDADGLGKANDKSHEYGDLFLKTVANAGREIAHRPLDAVMRRGDRSDEFIVRLPGDGVNDFDALEKKFNDAIKQNPGNENFTASLAFGVYGNGRTARETVRLLDEKLSEAKAGRPKGDHINTIFYTK